LEPSLGAQLESVARGGIFMGGRSQINFGLRAVILAIMLISGGLGTVAYCQSGGVSLIIKQFPAQGGTVNPGLGVHHFNPNEEVALTAIPKPGFKFVCWLGDVSDAKASSTVTQANIPKVVIAVFESTVYEGLFPKTYSTGGGGKAQFGGGGGIIGVGNNVSLAAGGGGKIVPKVVVPDSAIPPWPEDPEPPVVVVPVSDDPVVPEPATGILLTLGGLLVFFKRRTKRPSR
jgi:hypothetical protein